MTGPHEPDDAVLIRRALGGDDRAFADLVARHKGPLYRLLRRYAGDPEEAYEAVQEAFVAAWSALKRYDPERPFLAWLRTIAINKARDRARRASVRRLFLGAATLDDAAAQAHRAPEPLADETLVEREQLSRLDRAIAKLPERLRAPLVLTALEGLSHQEAGEILGVTPKTIETRAYRARKLLAQTLDGELRPGR